MSLVQTVSFANPTSSCFPPAPAYGSFSATTTQGVPAALFSVAVYDTVDIVPVGVSVPNLPQSSIRIGVAGIYEITAHAQCDKTGPGSSDLEMFLKIGINSVANTASRVQINQNQEVLLTDSWIVPLQVGDNVSVCFASSVADMRIVSYPAGPQVPVIPSIAVTLVRIA